jgi:hypothetical protein
MGDFYRDRKHSALESECIGSAREEAFSARASPPTPAIRGEFVSNIRNRGWATLRWLAKLSTARPPLIEVMFF